jgi:hypothetical protein
MLSIFKKWFQKEKLEFTSPYTEKDLENAFNAGLNISKNELMLELLKELETEKCFYPIGGICRPVLTDFELERFKNKHLK